MHLLGFPLLVIFLLAFLRREPVRVEVVEDRESSADDPIRFRVESEDWMPVGVKRD